MTNLGETTVQTPLAPPAVMSKSCFHCGSTDLSQAEMRGRPGRCRYCGSLISDATTPTAAPQIAVGLYMGSDAVNADNLRKALTIVERVTGKAPTVITDHNTGARVYVVNGYEQRFNTVEFVKLARQLNGEGARAAEVVVAMASKPNGVQAAAETGDRRSESDDLSLVKSLEIGKIRRDGGTQPRAALDDAVLAEYAEEMEAGSLFPPVTLFYDGNDYWLADGFHRVNAAIRAGRERINVTVLAGSQRDAILFSVGANSDHGLRRSNADKRRAVERLLRDPEWEKWSDGVVASRCAVSQAFASKVRRELTQNGFESKNAATFSTQRMGADGRFINTEQIGRAPAAQPIPAPVRITPPAVATNTLADMADLADSIMPERLDQLKRGIRQWLKFSYTHTASGAQAITLLQGVLDRKTRAQQSDWEQLTQSRFMPPCTPGERLLAVQAVLQELQASTPATSAPKPPAKDLDAGYQPRSARDPALMERRRVARAEAGLLPDSEELADYGQVLAGVKAWLHRYCAPNNQYAIMSSLAANNIDAHEHWRNLYVSPYLPLVYNRSDLQTALKAVATALAPDKSEDKDNGISQLVAATPAPNDLGAALAVLMTNLNANQRQEVGENLAGLAATEAEWARSIEAGKLKQPERLIIHQTTVALLYLVRDAIR